MEGTVAPSAIVLEVLNEDNYERWSVWVRTYLLANDLWEFVVETSSEPEPSQSDFKVWRKKNAQALHAIQISCGLETFTLISEFNSASRAWKKLAETLKPSLPELLCNPGFEDSAKIFPEYEPFFDAVTKGEWDDGTRFLDEKPDAITARFPYSGQTALHIATDAGHTRIVEKLVRLMPEGSLEIKAYDGMTALAVAANKGYTRMAKCMVEKNARILGIGDAANRIPLVLACRNGHSDMIRYLYVATPSEDLMPGMGPNGATIVSQCFADKRYDLAWSLIQRYPLLAVTKDHYGLTPLYALSGVPSAFPSGMKLKLLQRLIYKCIYIKPTPLDNDDIRISVDNIANDKDNQRVFIGSVRGIFQLLVTNLLRLLGINRISEMKLIHVRSGEFLELMCKKIKGLDMTQMQNACVSEAIFQAVERGIPEFIIKICSTKPELVWSTNEKKRSIFHFAIECRQEKIYNLIYGLGMKDAFASLKDTSNNSMLHIAAMLPRFRHLSRITGGALKIQRELQWFKEVETIVPLQYRENTNLPDNKRPRDLFTKYHKKLVAEGEKWMKDTAGSCSVVGALIVTIMFAAAFTVPGGNDESKGFPIFINDKLFSLFIISDAISLFCSTTSSLMFLEILTSRFAEEDFLKSLPTKMLVGLFSLFLSIATMMLAFCAALVIMLQGKPWTVFPVICLASVPVSLFACMKFPLFVEIFNNTYRSRVFNRKMKSWL